MSSLAPVFLVLAVTGIQIIAYGAQMESIFNSTAFSPPPEEIGQTPYQKAKLPTVFFLGGRKGPVVYEACYVFSFLIL